MVPACQAEHVHARHVSIDELNTREANAVRDSTARCILQGAYFKVSVAFLIPILLATQYTS